MKRMDYRRYNGAALLGLRGLVFKSHGSADVLAFEQAPLNRAYDAARNNLLDRVGRGLRMQRPCWRPQMRKPRPVFRRRHIDETLFPHYRHRRLVCPRAA